MKAVGHVYPALGEVDIAEDAAGDQSGRDPGEYGQQDTSANEVRRLQPPQALLF